MNMFMLRAVATLALLIVASLPASAADVVRVASGPTDSGSAVYYALDLGYFKNAGLDVKLDILANGSAVAAGVASGTIDIAQSSLPSLAVAHERGIPFVLIAPGALYSSKAPTSALVVAKNSPVRVAKDLNGKIIGNNGLKNIGDISAYAWLDANGADISTVKILEMPFGEMQPALEQGRIDAAVLVEPALGVALTHNVRILAPAYSSIAPLFMVNAYVTTVEWAKQHPDIVNRFDTAIRAANKWANQPANHVRSAAILEKYTKVALAPQNTRVVFADSLDPALIQPVIEASAKFHVLKDSFPANDFILAGTH
jgi:NitT/TauT family transport system substrate-binding protein